MQFVKMLKMDKLGLMFEEMVFPKKQTLRVIYTTTTKHLKNGLISDVVAVAMATMMVQYGGYLWFKLV